MNKTIFIFLGILLNLNLNAQNDYTFPLQISNNHRTLVDQQGKPFFWAGEAAWSLIAQLNLADVEYYLDDRIQKGFTVLMVNLLEHKFASRAPANIHGDLPFTGKPFVSPDEKYFSYAGQVIHEADKRGIIVLLCPLYLGWEYGDEGWGAEVKKAGLTDLRRWGRYVGNRYKGFDNIIWCIGGDADPSLEKDKVLAFVNGLRESDPDHLITAHNIPETYADTPWDGMDWLHINNLYSYSKTLYTLCETAYDRKPGLPYFMIESAYENEHNATPRRLRSEIYWPVLCGAMGFLGGNCPIWHFSSDSTFCRRADWKTQLDLPGSMSISYLQKLFTARPWYLLEPDFDHRYVTGGFNEWGDENYIVSARASDGSTLIAYLPEPAELTVDLESISGDEARCWWYNPSSGNAERAGIFPTAGYKKFSPPDAGDWVLVIDDDSHEFGMP